MLKFIEMWLSSINFIETELPSIDKFRIIIMCTICMHLGILIGALVVYYKYWHLINI